MRRRFERAEKILAVLGPDATLRRVWTVSKVIFYQSPDNSLVGIRPQFHSWVSDKAPWDSITDKLPQFDEAWSR